MVVLSSSRETPELAGFYGRVFGFSFRSGFVPRLGAESSDLQQFRYGVNTPYRPPAIPPIIYLTMNDNELVQEGEPTGASVQSQSRTLSRPRILVVDDDRDLRQLYNEALSRPGYHVDTVEDGATAWEALQANHYHLLITEHNIPGLTGTELVRKLRAARMDLPVVMAAVRLPAEDVVLDRSLQLAAVLPKPFYVSQLLETVREVLRATDGPCEQSVPPPGRQSRPSTVGLQL